MKHVRIWLRSGAVVEATVDDLTFTVHQDGPLVGKLATLGWTNSGDSSVSTLGYADIADIAAITYRDA